MLRIEVQEWVRFVQVWCLYEKVSDAGVGEVCAGLMQAWERFRHRSGWGLCRFDARMMHVLQCWFKLSGQNEQNLNFQTRFSQIGLRLDKKWRGQKLLRISPELIWCHFFSEILNKNFTPKLGHFGFFQLIKNYAETTLLIDKKIISQEASHAVSQILTRVKSSKTSKREKIFTR